MVGAAGRFPEHCLEGVAATESSKHASTRRAADTSDDPLGKLIRRRLASESWIDESFRRFNRLYGLFRSCKMVVTQCVLIMLKQGMLSRSRWLSPVPTFSCHCPFDHRVRVHHSDDVSVICFACVFPIVCQIGSFNEAMTGKTMRGLSMSKVIESESSRR